MKENQAIQQAMAILNKADERELKKEDGAELKKLQEFISKDKFSSLWSAYLTASDEYQLQKV